MKLSSWLLKSLQQHCVSSVEFSFSPVYRYSTYRHAGKKNKTIGKHLQIKIDSKVVLFSYKNAPLTGNADGTHVGIKL